MFMFMYMIIQLLTTFRLKDKELLLLAKLIHNSIYNFHPKFKLFVNYWHDVTNI